MNETHKSILHARPKLRTVSPLAYWITFILAVFNVILGVSLFVSFDAHRIATPLIIVNDLFTYQFWGVIFASLGVFKFWALFTNNWKMARQSLIMGVVLKATWAIALTIRTIISPGTLFINLIWIALALIQSMTYIFFMPPSIQPGVTDKSNKEVGDAK